MMARWSFARSLVSLVAIAMLTAACGGSGPATEGEAADEPADAQSLSAVTEEGLPLHFVKQPIAIDKLFA